MRDARLAAVACLLAWLGVACSNNPYPDSDDKERVLYLNYQEAPKTLDPAVAYSTVDHMIVGPVFDTLLQYHFLERPYRLIPGLLAEMPEVTPRDDGRVVFRLKLRDDLLFQDDPCFALGTPGATTRPVMAADVAFQLMRLADPKVNSPVAPTMARIAGFEEFAGRLTKLRKDDPAFTRAPHRRAVRDSGRHRRRARARSGRARDRAPRGIPAVSLLARDGVHRARPVGGGRVLRRARRSRGVRRASRRHRTVPARALRQAAPHRAGPQPELARRAAPRSARARARSIPARASPTMPHAAGSTRRTSDGRCRSSIASTSSSTRRTSPPSPSSSRATTTSPASSRRASTVSCTRDGCRRRCRSSTCSSPRPCSPPSTTWASTCRIPWSARPPAIAVASCARR